jgi:hypothetical protein
MTNPEENQQSEGKKKEREIRVRGVMIKRILKMLVREIMKRRRLSSCVIFVWNTTRLISEEAHNILTQQHPVVLTNPFPQGKNLR